MAEFTGFVSVGAVLTVPFLTKPATRIPTNADADPTYRIYGPTGSDKVMSNGSGTASKRHTGNVTNVADNGSSLCRVTSASHGLYTGQRVTVASVGGATQANGSYPVTVIDANTFDLVGSSAPSAYTSGGSWNVAGLYYLSHTLASVDGYAASTSYSVVIDYAISSVQLAEITAFQVS